MKIKTLLEKLKDHTLLDSERGHLSTKQTKIFSKSSFETLIQFQELYKHVSPQKRSWKNFKKNQDDVLAECLEKELSTPKELREEQKLAYLTPETEINSL